MRQRYDSLVEEMRRRYGIRVNRWRQSMTGCAWEVRYADGGSARLVEAPYPKGPMSAAIFLHEVGHHAIGLGKYSPRCLEEYYAWMWALKTMGEFDITITDGVKKRLAQSLRYAVAKAVRRRLKRLPVELHPYLPPGVRLVGQ